MLVVPGLITANYVKIPKCLAEVDAIGMGVALVQAASRGIKTPGSMAAAQRKRSEQIKSSKTSL